MLYVGLDLSRERLDWQALDREGERVAIGAAPPDREGLGELAKAIGGAPVLAVIESMTGARFVHDQLERRGWDVRIADAVKARGIAPLACKTDRIDCWVLAELARLDLVPEIWLPDRFVRAERERARFRLHLVRHRSSLKKSGERDRRGPLRKNGPNHLRWALVEAAHTACRHPLYSPVRDRMRERHGTKRGTKIAAIEIARRLSEAIWQMLTNNQPFAPAGAAASLAA